MTQKMNISGLLPNPPTGGILEHIQSYLKNSGIPSYRFQQLVYSLQRGYSNFEDAKELPKPLREQLISHFGTTPIPLTIVESHSSKQVEKVLFETKSKAKIETVLSHYRTGWTSMCISSQCGCGLGCSFCATAAMGLLKNLTADEICAQVFHPYWQKRLPDSIAFMGMGEALANPNIFTAIEAFTTRGYGGLSPRRITVPPNLKILF